jgi:hypothetical protein
LEAGTDMTIVAEWLVARLPTATEGNLIIGNLERIAIAVEQNKTFRVLDVERAIFFSHDGRFGVISHMKKLLWSGIKRNNTLFCSIAVVQDIRKSLKNGIPQ